MSDCAGVCCSSYFTVLYPCIFRSLQEAAVFTFMDHDGSVQSAAAIPPLPVDGDHKAVSVGVPSSAPILLTYHGTGVTAQVRWQLVDDDSVCECLCVLLRSVCLVYVSSAFCMCAFCVCALCV